MLLCACSHGSTATTVAAEKPKPVATPFCADSAYAYVAQQVAFGPRVPGSEASRQCAQWLCQKLSEFGASNIVEQHTTLKAYNGDILNINNITARFNPQAQHRVLLLAHWDSRPWADQDPDPAMRLKPIDGANDGASGVAVILELLRALQSQQSQVGIDVLLTDAEDYGHREGDNAGDAGEDSWCLGTQYWVKNPSFDLSEIDYAILLDMVGGKDAKFPREYHSQYAAKEITDKVWTAAHKAGYADRFPERVGGVVVDDHVYLLMAGIPAIDIIESAHPDTGSFPPTWHTQADNLSNIDPATLAAVGNTLYKLFNP